MKFTVLSVMSDVEEVKGTGKMRVVPCEDVHQKLVEMSGKNAGICYMQGDYFDSAVTDSEKAEKRAIGRWGEGHHSISGHEQVKVLLEGITKALAMLLNNLGCYETSEKSGRYTEISGNTEIEKEKYNKWKAIFQKLIKEKVEDLDDKKIEKLAMENARYMVGFFSSFTTMAYTTSIRQWNYIADWCDKFVDKYNNRDVNEDSLFERIFKCDKQLAEMLGELSKQIKNSVIYYPELRDNKNRSFNMYHDSKANIRLDKIEETDLIGNVNLIDTFDDMIVANSWCSLVMLAQLQRHRTGKVSIDIDSKDKNLIYKIPTILEGTEYVAEWNKDIAEMQNYGILVNAYMPRFRYLVSVDDFVLMLKERLCGAAQLEIMQFASELTKVVHKRILDGKLYCDGDTLEILKKAVKDDKVVMTKCQYCKCERPCTYVKKGLENRII